MVGLAKASSRPTATEMMNAASIRPAVMAGSRFQELTGHDGQTETGAQRGQADHDADGEDGGALDLGEVGQDGEVHGFLLEL